MDRVLIPQELRYYNFYYRYYRMKEHRHGEDEIMYVTEGSCRTPCCDEDGNWKDICLTEGSYIHIRGGVLHNLFVERETPCRILNVEYLLPEGAKTTGCDYSVIRDDGSLLRILRVLHDKMRERDSRLYPDEETEAEDIGLAVLLLHGKVCMQHENPPAIPDLSEQYVEQAKQFLTERFTDRLSVSEIAREVGITEAYLQRLFRSRTGETITAYINSLRLKRSKYLLAHTDLSLTDVAENAGFGSRQRLAQIFRDFVGESPGQYRASRRK